MIWEFFKCFWEYLKSTAWFWQTIATLAIPLYFIWRDRKLKKDQLRYISEVISNFIEQHKKEDSGDIYKDHELLRNKDSNVRDAMVKQANFNSFLDRLDGILKNRAFNIDYKISFILEEFLRTARFTFDTYTNWFMYKNMGHAQPPPQSIEQIGLPDLLPIDFYKPYIGTLEQIQNEYLIEKTLWQKIKKLLEELKRTIF